MLLPFMPPIGHRWRHHSRRSKNHEHSIAPAQRRSMCHTRCTAVEARLCTPQSYDCCSQQACGLAPAVMMISSQADR